MSRFEWAKKELDLIGAIEDWDIYKPYLEIFAQQGHSGGSASIMLPILFKLLERKALSELTSNPEEWVDRTECSGYPIWQNTRDSRAFSKDGGKTYIFLDDPKFKMYFNT